MAKTTEEDRVTEDTSIVTTQTSTLMAWFQANDHMQYGQERSMRR